jgi:hypothetical protein
VWRFTVWISTDFEANPAALVHEKTGPKLIYKIRRRRNNACSGCDQGNTGGMENTHRRSTAALSYKGERHSFRRHKRSSLHRASKARPSVRGVSLNSCTPKLRSLDFASSARYAWFLWYISTYTRDRCWTVDDSCRLKQFQSMTQDSILLLKQCSESFCFYNSVCLSVHSKFSEIYSEFQENWFVRLQMLIA